MHLFHALKARPFALFLSGQFISTLGDSLYNIAIAWWVADRTGSAEAMGQVLAFAFVPRLVFLLLGGVIGDRLPRIRVLLFADVVQGVITGLIALLAALGRLEILQVYAASLLTGSMAALAQPAFAAMIPDVTVDEHLLSANSLISLSAHLTGVIGPALGALLVQQAGYSAAFALDALSFFISAIFLIALRRSKLTIHTRAEAKFPLWEDLSMGWRYVAGQTWLWAAMLILLLVNFSGRSTMNVALPFLVERNLRAGVGGFGLLQSAFGVGSVLGAVWLGQRIQMERKGRIFYGSLVATGLLTAGLGLPFPLPVLAAAVLLMGSCLAVCNLVWSVVLQERAPRAMLGRVSSLGNVSSTALLPLGFWLAGGLTNLAGAPVVFLLGGALTAGLALTGLLIRPTRGM